MVNQAKQKAPICENGDTVLVKVNLIAVLTVAEEGGYNCYCPALKISSQGDNLKEARANIIEAATLFIESCVARNCLGKALSQRGLAKVLIRKQRKQRYQSASKANSKKRTIEFRVLMPLAA